MKTGDLEIYLSAGQLRMSVVTKL